MNEIIALLNANPDVDDYKINIRRKESDERFFVKGKLETVRHTDTCDKEITVYVNHGDFKGDSQFLVYPSTTEEQLKTLIEQAVQKAKLINNQNYKLPEGTQGEYAVPSNFADMEANDLMNAVCNAVFAANDLENADLNSVEVFINRHTGTVINSKGMYKTQVRYDAMVEAIPTYNGQEQSVELYQQYNFSDYSQEQIQLEIREKLQEVKARYEAKTPDFPIDCKVILNKLELSELIGNIVYDLNYAAVYAHANLFKKGDEVQKTPMGDKLQVFMEGAYRGSTASACFDADGLELGSIQVIRDGVAVNYYGANRHGQYLDEVPTGNLPIARVAKGSVKADELQKGPYLEVISMSGLQVDFYNDYIGGEVRLAYYNDGIKTMPVTGISITGSASKVLSGIRFSDKIVVCDRYAGPHKAILQDMKVF
jgi:predicted Zn-dependent protease